MRIIGIAGCAGALLLAALPALHASVPPAGWAPPRFAGPGIYCDGVWSFPLVKGQEASYPWIGVPMPDNPYMPITANGASFAMVSFPEMPADITKAQVVRQVEGMTVYQLEPRVYAVRLDSERVNRWHRIDFSPAASQADIDAMLNGAAPFETPPANCLKAVVDERQGRDSGPKTFCTPLFGLELKDDFINWSTFAASTPPMVMYNVENGERTATLAIVTTAEENMPIHSGGWNEKRWTASYHDKASGKYVHMSGNELFRNRVKTGAAYKKLCKGQKIIGAAPAP